MSRGRGRRASSLVPGNGGAPAPTVARRTVHGGPAGAARRTRRHALGAFARHGTSPTRSSSVPRAGASDVAPIPTLVFAPRYWRWLASAWPRENRHGRVRRPGRLTERRRDLTCTATPRCQNPFDSLGARTTRNGEPNTDRIQPITRTESPPGDDDLAPPGRRICLPFANHR